MSVIITASRVQGGQYNFANDPSLGAVGSVGLGVYLPKNSVITRFWIQSIVGPKSANSTATISFIMGTGGKTLFSPVLVGALGSGTVNAGIDFNANPAASATVSTPTPQVTMVIGVESLTGGNIIFSIEYTEKDL